MAVLVAAGLNGQAGGGASVAFSIFTRGIRAREELPLLLLQFYSFES